MSLFSLAIVFATGYADEILPDLALPRVSLDSVITLLKVLSSSMLVIATLAVTSMVSAYHSASNSATPRAFPLIISDDLSQYALSTFIGAFIFSVITLVAVLNGAYGNTGTFVLLVVTMAVFTVVILTFVRWVDGIARLGLTANTIEKIESTTARAIRERLRSPRMGGVAPIEAEGAAVFSRNTGYIQLVDVDVLQKIGEEADIFINVRSLPGRLVVPGRELAHVTGFGGSDPAALDRLEATTASKIANAFVIGRQRTFDEDPRFGLVALSQIACRAMSPAVNDPGTAIDILAALVRLLGDGVTSRAASEPERFTRVGVPDICLDDLFDDAFSGVGRDAAGHVEVAVRIQVALASLASLGDNVAKKAAGRHARLALQRAEEALCLEQDVSAVREAYSRGSY